MHILGVRYDNLTKAEALEQMLALLKQREKANVFFVNADCVYRAQHDAAYRQILNAADLVLSDGIGLQCLTKLFGATMKDNCNGTDLIPVLLERVAQAGYRVFFLGAREGIAQRAAVKMQAALPALKIVGTHHGYFQDDQQAIDLINAAHPEVLLVARGVPLQEQWITQHREQLQPKLCLVVGGLFDHLSGHTPRAPKLLRACRLEWFWRILLNPQRMFKRYIINGVCLLGIAVREKLATPNK